jgi:hypothetical protein
MDGGQGYYHQESPRHAVACWCWGCLNGSFLDDEMRGVVRSAYALFRGSAHMPISVV